MGIRRGAAGFKPGDIKSHGGETIEAGWLICAGQAVSRATYAALFLAVGTTHGAGDGATTFNIPDLRGRALFGKDNMGGIAANRLTSGAGGVDGAMLGAVGGGQTVTLTSNEMPSHTHPSSAMGSVNSRPVGGGAAESATTGTNTGGAGGGGAHVNVPPCLVANYIIKT